MYKDTSKLTPRQIEILDLLAKGYSNKKICNTLFVAETTLRTHINILNKKFKIECSKENRDYSYRVKLVLKYQKIKKSALIQALKQALKDMMELL